MPKTKTPSYLKNIKMCMPPSEFPPEGVSVIKVLENDYKLGMLYTHGMYRYGHPELLLVDIPADEMGNYTNFALGVCSHIKRNWGKGDSYGYHGYKTGRDIGCWVTLLKVAGSHDYETILSVMKKCNPTAEIMIAKPLFDKWEALPGAPEGKKEMQYSILEKWSDRNLSIGGFLLFLDGNKQNSRYDNIIRVSGYDMFKYPSSTDWDEGLTDREVTYVKQHWEHFAFMGVGCCARVPLDSADVYVKDVVENLCDMEERYKQGIKLVNGSYTWDMAALETSTLSEGDDAIPELQCAMCGKDKTRVCAKCKTTPYCSKSCQKNHWKTHKKSCCKD